MAGARSQRATDDLPAHTEVVLRNAWLHLRYRPSGELVVTRDGDDHSLVIGGPLIELTPGNITRRGRAAIASPPDDAATPEPEPFADVHGAGTCLRVALALGDTPLAVAWVIRLYDNLPCAVLELTARNTGTEPLRLRRMFPFAAGAWWAKDTLRLGERSHDFSVYKSGWQSWSYAGGLPPGTGDPRPRVPTNVAWHSPGGATSPQPVVGTVDVVSEAAGMLGHPEQTEALLLGFLGAETWLGSIYAQRREGAFAAAALLDDALLPPGATLSAPPLALALGEQTRLLEQYAALVAVEQGARGCDAVTPSGWCSWYYYFTEVTEAAILENLTQMRALRPALPLAVAQIDDGYQTAIGDWLSVNTKFPSGMAALAERIRAAGFRPGLWLAPFTVAANSQLAKEHPDWLVHDARGKPVFGGHNWDIDLYGLDTTHPGARDWLRQLFTTLVREWGYAYLKLDFLVSGALPGQRHDATATRASALRDGLRLIREVVGDEVFLLGCGCPLLSAVGIVDAMRIGPDSAPYWGPRYKGVPMPFNEGFALPAQEGAIRNTLTRAWTHRAWWLNDPDCLLVRERESELTLDEVRSLATAIGLTGGMVLASDRLAELSAERVDLLAQLLPPMPECALPVNSFDFGIPELVSVRIQRPWGEWLLAGVFNRTDGERTVALRWADLGLASGTYHAAEFWSKQYLGASSSGIELRLEAHGCAALAIHRQSDAPLLLSTSFHIAQGAVEIAAWDYDTEARTLRWRAEIGRRASGTFMLWLPDDLTPHTLSSTAERASWRREVTGEIVVTAWIVDHADFVMELEDRDRR
ncbi:MAG: Alpha-galactosidase [Ktedonobacterales bacterium]|jgi:alpha-galactosidase|nr:MAG: Alpha-galactosidase [Ktedonobacterales bacterium]